MRRTLSIAVACAGLVIAIAPAAKSAEAATITAVGWWSQRPGATELPAGSFEVALLPNAPQSVAALRVDVKAAPLTTALLQLLEAEQVLGDVARVQACPTNDNWQPANPGPWADAPTADCADAAVALGRNADGTWTADVGSLLGGGSTSLMIVPLVEVNEQQQSVAFQVTFAGARLVASAAAGTTATRPTPTPAASFAPAPPFGTSGAGFEAQPTFPPSSTALATGTPAAVTPLADTSLAAPAEQAGPAKPWWRLAIGLPVSIAAGAGAVLIRRWLRERDMLGA
ncbi:MAG: hypothetical protein ACRDKJ_09470 [Actinomycetota bacterium]